GKGNIRLTAPGNMEFSAGKDIIMNSGKNLKLKTGNSMEFMSGNLAAFHMMSGAVFSTPLMEMSVPVHLNIQSGKTSLFSEEETIIQGRTTNVAGMEKLMIHSDRETTVNSKGTTHVLGKDGNSHSNIPRDYNPLEKKMNGRCLVHFRPKENWKGVGYGFDWVRSGDTALPGDRDYRDVMGWMDGKKFMRDEKEYLKLISSFRNYTFDYIDADGNVTSMSYAFPYLCLYPKTYFRTSRGAEIKKDSKYTNTTADLDLMVDIKRPVDEIVLKYDRKKFAITHDPFPLSTGNHRISARITCLEEIENDHIIEVQASYKGPDDTVRKMLAGGLVVKANNKRYEVPIVFIEVKTDIGNGKRFSEIWAREHESQTYLNQALINPVFKDKISIDCSEDIHPVSGIVHNRRCRLNACAALRKRKRGDISMNDEKHGNEVIYFLKDELESLYPGKYDDVIKIFVVDEACDTAAGYALSTQKTAVLFRGGFDTDNRNVTTHEIMHVLGLPHTFENESIFVFEKYSTDNIMDYSDTASDYSMRKNVYSTSHWQWGIMQKNSRPEISSSRYFRHPDPILFLSL
ncbi:reprolysin-like metallopeptidase, partial [uncultured Chryseobacterium sp.]|uniref:reprolysin-like metallopeptidase n=1 Tax=uncultured Chryseobacterium sp. TaxID=259322 RepID=UPI0025EBC6A6